MRFKEAYQLKKYTFFMTVCAYDAIVQRFGITNFTTDDEI